MLIDTVFIFFNQIVSLREAALSYGSKADYRVRTDTSRELSKKQLRETPERALK